MHMSLKRPLFKHIRDHDSLFSELAFHRNHFIEHLGLSSHDYHKTPKFVTEDGRRLTIEPERSIVVDNHQIFAGLKPILTKEVKGFNIVHNSDIGFRYPTAALAGKNAPYIKRFRSEFFHRVDESRDICRPINLSYGIKSRGKGDNREEYEVWVDSEHLENDPSPLFIEKYNEDLPDEVRQFAAKPPIVHGWMGVKRAAFEGTYQNKVECGDIAVVIALSVDVYNIGARPDLSFEPNSQSSIAISNAEFEWEVMGYYAPKHLVPTQEQIWHAIHTSIKAISQPLQERYHKQIIPTSLSKTERILNTVEAFSTSKQIEAMNLKPWEFLETSSQHRRKAHDPSRSVNLLGRLNRLFYQTDYTLPSLKAIHELIEG